MRTTCTIALVAFLGGCGVSSPTSLSSSLSATPMTRAAGAGRPLPLCHSVPHPTLGSDVALEEVERGQVIVIVDGHPLCGDSLDNAASSGLLPETPVFFGRGNNAASSDPMP